MSSESPEHILIVDAPSRSWSHQHKGLTLNNRAADSHQPTRRREQQMKQFKSVGLEERLPPKAAHREGPHDFAQHLLIMAAEWLWRGD
jgi:hypothetical protein